LGAATFGAGAGFAGLGLATGAEVAGLGAATFAAGFAAHVPEGFAA
jgi:hypothetical protein